MDIWERGENVGFNLRVNAWQRAIGTVLKVGFLKLAIIGRVTF